MAGRGNPQVAASLGLVGGQQFVSLIVSPSKTSPTRTGKMGHPDRAHSPGRCKTVTPKSGAWCGRGTEKYGGRKTGQVQLIFRQSPSVEQPLSWRFLHHGGCNETQINTRYGADLSNHLQPCKHPGWPRYTYRPQVGVEPYSSSRTGGMSPWLFGSNQPHHHPPPSRRIWACGGRGCPVGSGPGGPGVATTRC